jgi:hypothetical protein
MARSTIEIHEYLQGRPERLILLQTIIYLPYRLSIPP